MYTGEPKKPKVGDRLILADVEYEVREIFISLKQCQRRARTIRQNGGVCSYHRVGHTYCILHKVPIPTPNYFFEL